MVLWLHLPPTQPAAHQAFLLAKLHQKAKIQKQFLKKKKKKSEFERFLVTSQK
jgi:hypothetical protein